jgi:hypothetical protein
MSLLAFWVDASIRGKAQTFQDTDRLTNPVLKAITSRLSTFESKLE